MNKFEVKTIFMASLGGALEFYDFIIFIFLANVISPQYFPAKNHINSLLALFSAFVVGYLARPIGGLIFAHFGDLYGRKKTFYFSIILMAIPSLLIAVLPNYQTIGFIAPLCLVLLRIIQGTAIGGEVPGAITFTFEHVAERRRGRIIVLIFFALSIATLLGQAVVTLLHTTLSSQQFSTWGWRIAFIIGAILGFIGAYLRNNLSETPAFKQLAAKPSPKLPPSFLLMKAHFHTFLQGLSILCLGAVSMFLIFIYLPIYITNFKSQLTITESQLQLINTINLCIFSIFMLIVGRISDWLGRKKLIILGSLLLAIFAYPLFIAILKGSLFSMSAALIALGVSFSLVAGCYGTTLAELFPTNIRYTGVSLAYNLAFAALGGTTPLIATLLVKMTGNPIMPAFYLMVFAAISLIGTLTIKVEKLY